MKEVKVTISCEWCAGTGVQPVSAAHLVPCDECQGSGIEMQVSWHEADANGVSLSDMYVEDLEYA